MVDIPEISPLQFIEYISILMVPVFIVSYEYGYTNPGTEFVEIMLAVVVMLGMATYAAVKRADDNP